MRIKRNVAIATAAVTAAVLAGGGAYAATQSSSANPQTRRQAFLSDVAKRLGIPESKLTAALQAAFIDQLNAAVKAGRLTQPQANQIAKRVQQGQLPPLGRFGARPPHGGGLGAFAGPPHGGGPLGAAATYLGLTPAQILTQLQSGKTLAQIAQSRGKSTAGLQSAMVAAVRSRLDQAVKNGRIASAQEQQILSTLSSGIADQINGKAPPLAHPGRGFRGGWGGPGGFAPAHPGAFEPPPGAPGSIA